MQFTYHEEAGASSLSLSRNEFAHLFKVRRVKEGSTLAFRNMVDSKLYMYSIESLGRREATLKLLSAEEREVMPSHSLTIGWAIIDLKVAEKALPMLNEMGVSKVAFVYTDFSQQHFFPDLERLRRIVISSSQQCGRSSLMQFEIYDTLDEYLSAYPETFVVDFSTNRLETSEEKPTSMLIGCEGGFSENERERFISKKIVGLETPLILRSESAVVAVAAKILL